MTLRPRTTPARSTVSLENAQPGDRVYLHSTHFLSRLIQGAQWLRWRAASRWNHMFILVAPAPGGDWKIVQASRRGVVYAFFNDEVKGGDYAIVSGTADGFNGANVVDFAEGEVGEDYGVLVLLSVVFNLYTPSFIHIDFRKSGTWICSALAMESSRFGGVWRQWKDIYSVTPAMAWLEEDI